MRVGRTSKRLNRPGLWASSAAAALLFPLAAPSPALADEPGPSTPAAPGQAPAAVPEEPDDAFVEQCTKDPEANSEQGRTFNRGVWCQHTTGHGEILVNGRSAGRADITYTAVAYADPADRKVRVFFRVDEFDTQPGGVINAFSTMKMGLNCNTCETAGNDESDKSNMLLTWRDLTGWVSWNMTSTEDGGIGPELVSRHRWNFSGQIITNTGQATIPGVGRDHRIRCDSAGRAAGYSNWTPRACINDDVIPFLTYSKSDPNVAGVARHLDTAMNDPAATYPDRGTPKKIPGKYTGVWGDPGLHRIPVGSPAYNENRLEQGRIRDRNAPWNGPDDLPARPAPPPRPDGGTWQADEFPFASTREGLGKARKDADAGGTFNGSVDWVDNRQNQRAGIELREYYKNDRILYGDHDQFYVNIAP